MSIVIKIFGILVIFVGLFYFLVFSPFKLIGLHKIVGSDVGQYKKEQTVLARSVVYQNYQVKEGDVVIFNRPLYQASGGFSNGMENMNVEYTGSTESIGQIVGVAGDPIQGEAAYFDSRILTGVVPDGYYLLKTNSSQSDRALSIKDVKEIVWMGL